MTMGEMREFVRLLRKYQDDLLVLDANNKLMKKNSEKSNGYYCYDPHIGIRSQYEHARLILRKLDKQVNEDIMSTY